MILGDIAEKRLIQLAREKAAVPFEEIKKQAESAPVPKDFKKALLKGNLSVIAEVKKASPSKGTIRPDFHPVEIAKSYEEAGADALSVLTEEFYFKGSAEYLKEIRKAVSLPILRKDFVIDSYQIYEARTIGADAVLLIAALLDNGQMREYIEIAHSLGLCCLTEAHNEEELSAVLSAGSDMIGINNRDLRTFRVDLATTEKLVGKVPKDCTVVSESGIASHADMQRLKNAGVNAVLIGETLMRSSEVASTLQMLREGL